MAPPQDGMTRRRPAPCWPETLLSQGQLTDTDDTSATAHNNFASSRDAHGRRSEVCRWTGVYRGNYGGVRDCEDIHLTSMKTVVLEFLKSLRYYTMTFMIF
ncbi:hypothetical protein NQZ68_002483 [Dissostichus eleginoides]|nr:hypothetical protein NQZ68_002483 [Dissostichus eleginoides]